MIEDWLVDYNNPRPAVFHQV